MNFKETYEILKLNLPTIALTHSKNLLFGVGSFLIGGALLAILALVFQLQTGTMHVIGAFIFYALIAIGLSTIGKLVRGMVQK